MTHHTWRHVIFWLLHLGVVWLPLPSLTADLNKACQAHAEGKFKIRAMIYTSNFAYLVASDGQLFVEDATTFIVGIEQKPPSIELNKPIFSLPTNWHQFGQVDYANPAIHFGFTNEHPDDLFSDTVILRMITYNEPNKFGVCVYNGFVLNGREAPSSSDRESVCVESSDKPAFWLNDKWTMYPITLKQLDSGTEMNADKFDTRDNVQLTFLKVTTWNKEMVAKIGIFSESNVKPQSGLLTNRIIFLATEDSTGHFFAVDKRLLQGTVRWFQNPQLGSASGQWKLKEVVKLQFCQVEPQVEPKVDPKEDPEEDQPFDEDTIDLPDLSKDSVKPANTAPYRKIPYLVLTGIFLILIALVVYAMINWPKKKKPTRKCKKGDKASKRASFWGKIGALIDKVFPCTCKRMVSNVQESRAISLASDLSSAKKNRGKKRGKGGKKGDSKTGHFWGTMGGFLAKVSPFTAKKKRSTILVSTVRESILLASLAAVASKASPPSKRRKKGAKVGPKRRAPPRPR